MTAPAPRESVEALRFSDTGGTNIETGVVGGSCVAEGFSLADQKRGILVQKLKTKYGDFLNFVQTNFIKDCIRENEKKKLLIK